jgi:hypothetical protein
MVGMEVEAEVEVGIALLAMILTLQDGVIIQTTLVIIVVITFLLTSAQ